MPRPDCVLFDLDGTLIDTAPDFITVLNKMLEETGKDSLPADIIRANVSNGARALVTLGFGVAEQDPRFPSLRARLLELYAECLSDQSCLFPGMESVLSHLEIQQVPWGIVTNKPRQYAEPLIADLDLSKRCGALVCPDDVKNTKPDPEPIYLACSQLKTKPTTSVYVGDHIRDIEAGRNAGCKTVACGFGYISSSDDINNWQADHIIQTAAELLPLISS